MGELLFNILSHVGKGSSEIIYNIKKTYAPTAAYPGRYPDGRRRGSVGR